ncbi:MAG: phosphatidate cytidylyltransferase [Haloferacaceae archaeon]
MQPSTSLRSRVSGFRLAVAVAVVVAVVAVVWAFDQPTPPFLVAMVALTAVYLVGSSVDAVRASPRYHLASACYTALLLGVWYVATGADSPFLLGLTILSLVGVAVEAYNYRHGTSHLRIDLADTAR